MYVIKYIYSITLVVYWCQNMGANIIGEIDASYTNGVSQADPTMIILYVLAYFGLLALIAIISQQLFPPTQADKEYERQRQIDNYLRQFK